MQSCKSAAGHGSERRGSVCKSGGIAPVCLFNKILVHEEQQVPVGAVCPPHARQGREGLCVHLSIRWIPLSASKASFESGSRVKTVLSGTVTVQGHQPVAQRCPFVPLAPGSAAVPQTVLGELGSWLATANTELNSLLTALQVRVYLLGFYIGI